jgi:hypothetical protein
MDSSDLILQFGVKELMYAFSSILAGGFLAAWTLLHYNVLTPLKELGATLESLKDLLAEHDKRVTLLEFKVSEITKLTED